MKFEQYYDDWRDRGFDIEIAPFMDMALWRILFVHGHFAGKLLGVARGYLRRLRDLVRIRGYDLVYCHMYVTPVGTSLAERILRLLARRLVYDVEDNVMSHVGRVDRHHPNPLLRFLRGSRKYRYLIQVADHVIASSPALSNRCAALNRNGASTYVSSSIDAQRFRPRDGYDNDHLLTIGWTGTFSTRPYLDLLRPVLQKLAKRRQYRLRVIGNFDYELPGVDLEVIRWSAEHEVEHLRAIDIGVYPLPNDEWVSGKSGLKAIQYMMIGLPCVATAAGTTPLIIRHGQNGLLARSEEEWLHALTTLIDEPELRRTLGETARKDAVARYSTAVVGAEYRAILSRVLKD